MATCIPVFPLESCLCRVVYEAITTHGSKANADGRGWGLIVYIKKNISSSLNNMNNRLHLHINMGYDERHNREHCTTEAVEYRLSETDFPETGFKIYFLSLMHLFQA